MCCFLPTRRERLHPDTTLMHIHNQEQHRSPSLVNLWSCPPTLSFSLLHCVVTPSIYISVGYAFFQMPSIFLPGI